MSDKYLEILKESIEETLKNLDEDFGKKENLSGKIVSGWGSEKYGYVYKLSPTTIFETSIVERLLINLFKKINSENEKIGWEINYTYSNDSKRSYWNKLKLDMALNFLGKDHLFDTVIEIKKWKLDSTIPHNVWNDIFKITGYQYCDGYYNIDNNFEDPTIKNKDNVGKNKYILLFFDKNDKNDKDDKDDKEKKEINDKIKETFIVLKYIKDDLKQKFQYKYTNEKDLIGYFMKNVLKWEEDETREFIINKIFKNDNNKVILPIDNDIKKGSFLFNEFKTIGAVLLKVNA